MPQQARSRWSKVKFNLYIYNNKQADNTTTTTAAAAAAAAVDASADAAAAYVTCSDCQR